MTRLISLLLSAWAVVLIAWALDGCTRPRYNPHVVEGEALSRHLRVKEYHGVDVIRCQGHRQEIFRGGKWIQINKH